jgi:hypothetical protein
MKSKLFFLALIGSLFFTVSAFALADAENSGTYQQPAISKDNVVYTITVSYSTADSTSDLHTKALYVGFWDISKPISVQAWGNAVTANDVNVDAEMSAELNDTQFLTLTTFDIDAAGAAASKFDYITGQVFREENDKGPADSTGAFIEPYAFLPYLRFECDGQTGNKSTSVLYLKVVVPVSPEWTEQDVRKVAGITPTT